jgi:hypothetical protein
MMVILFVNTVRLSFLIVEGNDSFSELWVLRVGNYTSFYVIRFSKSIAGCAWIRAFVSAIDLVIMNCIRRNQSLCFVGPIKLVVVILEYLWWETDFSHSRFHLLLRGFFFFFSCGVLGTWSIAICYLWWFYDQGWENCSTCCFDKQDKYTGNEVDYYDYS